MPIFSLLFLMIGSRYCKAENSPLVLVPGLLGSQLEAKLDRSSVIHSYCDKKSSWYTLWLSVEELVPFVINCFVDNSRLVYNNKTSNFSNVPGVSIRVPGFGNTSTIEYLDPSVEGSGVGDYFNKLVSAMKTIGYKPGISIRGAPYDWRQAPQFMPQLYTDLQHLIEETYSLNNKKKIVLLSHSLGCLHTLYFLTHAVSSQWKAQYLRFWIPIAGPWAGSAQLLKSFASGGNEDIVFVDPLTVRPQQRSFPSTAWLVPTPSVWNKSPVIITPNRNFTVTEYHDFFQAIGYPFGEVMVNMVSNITQSLPLPGVPVYCVHGYNVSTPSQFVYDDQFPNSQPTILNGNGDGTVNLESLVLCKNWEKKQKGKVIVTVVPNVKHFDLVSNDDVIKYVQTLVKL